VPREPPAPAPSPTIWTTTFLSDDRTVAPLADRYRSSAANFAGGMICERFHFVAVSA
jgi:hypothetical protein